MNIACPLENGVSILMKTLEDLILMKCRIGSFNIQKLNFVSTPTSAKDFKKIAQIIYREGLDVVALQEALTPIAVKRIWEYLPNKSKWDYRWDSPHYSTANGKEGYAYIWNTSRLELVESDNNPQIISGFGFTKSVYRFGKHLLRPPYYARFIPAARSGNTYCELRLLNVHILWDRPANANLEFIDGANSDYKNQSVFRKRELDLLIEDIYYKHFKNVLIREGNGRPFYTVMLGDYNLVLEGPGIKIDSEKSEIRGAEGNVFITEQREKTTLKRPANNTIPSDDGEEAEEELFEQTSLDYFSRNYDHFSYDSNISRYIGDIERVNAVEKYYNNDLGAYRKEISDHVPIKMVLNLNPRRKAWTTTSNLKQHTP